jgi:CRP-like cAMP-binding protein
LKVSIFEDIDAFSLEKLIITSETIIVNKGCNLYEENTPATHVYIVFQGTFEIIRKIESIESLTSQDVHISCVSEYQILGAEDLFLDGQSYSETVHCVSLRGVLLKIPNQRFTHMIRNKKRIMELCKSRENWKRNRVQMLEKTFTTQFPVQFANKPKRVMSSVSRPMKVYART